VNFLDHYINYASVNESPSIYHVWSGISTISHIVGRRVWTDMKMWQVYPNMYVCLVGIPGITKSTAMNVAKNFIKDEFPNIFRAPASITREAIIQAMAREDGECIRSFSYNGKIHKFSQMSVFANEMVSLINSGGAPLAMIDFLTDLWDQPEYRDKTKNKGDHTIKQPFLNVLGCFTTDTARTLMKDKIITGGMSRRCIFAYADRNKDPVPWIEYSDDQIASRAEMSRLAKNMLNFSGPFTWPSETKAFYTDWYKSNFYRAETETSDVLKNFLRSKTEYCIKVSMLLALAEEQPKLEHSLRNFQRAIELVTAVEKGASVLFDSGGRNELVSLATDIEKFISSRGTVDMKTLRKVFWKDLKNGDLEELKTVLTHLEAQGKVKLAKTPFDPAITWLGQKDQPGGADGAVVPQE